VAPGLDRTALGQAPEEVLVREAKGGDFEAFEELVRRYEERIYGLALRMTRHPEDAEDILQETFIRAFEHLPSFREESSFSTWLFRIATNAALMKLRRERSAEIYSLDQPAPDLDPMEMTRDVEDWAPNAEEMMEAEELRQLLEDAVGELPEIYRAVFILRDIEGLPAKEVARILDLSVPAVKSRLLRARLFLRERLSKTLAA
jgi:RNA polymerase sigma-70 factor (ECF subfamily)